MLTGAPRVFRRPGRALRGIVLLAVLAGLTLPILAGLAEMAVLARSAPGQGADRAGAFRQFLAAPGVPRAVLLSVSTGVLATAAALAIAFSLLVGLVARLGPARLAAFAAPVLAAPHAALAIGLALVIAPSGLVARLVSPWLTGWTVPPDLPLVRDGAGLGLTLGLVVKEVPFLLVMMIAVLPQIAVAREVAAARTLGHGRATAWVWIIGPQVYRLIRLPVYAVLAFSLSVVDMAMILGPSHPPTLGVIVRHWLMSPDLLRFAPGAAGALAAAALVAGMLVLWRLAEWPLARAARWRLARARPGRGAAVAVGSGAAAGALCLMLAALSVVAVLLWSVAWVWRFPDLWPGAFSLAAWQDGAAGWGSYAGQTLSLGLIATVLSLILAVGWLEAEARGGLGRAPWAEWLIYLPLLVPQVAFLYGTQVFFLRLGLEAGLAAVVWGHVLYAFPYVMITLSDPWRRFDPRLLNAAALLGAGPWRRLVRVRLAVLLGPLLTAAAVGFAVSVAQYVPTLFLGGGRVQTLTTEAVALASGADRRVTAVYAVLQAALPLCAYGLAFLVPSILYRHRRGLAGRAA